MNPENRAGVARRRTLSPKLGSFGACPRPTPPFLRIRYGHESYGVLPAITGGGTPGDDGWNTVFQGVEHRVPAGGTPGPRRTVRKGLAIVIACDTP